jgi:hypothetical protein
MILKFRQLARLQAPADDTPESGTDVAEMEPGDTSEAEEQAEELGDAVDEQAEEAQEELIVTIGDQEHKEDEEAAPNWVKELRKKNKEDQKRLRELEEENRKLKGGVPVEQEPKEPELEDFDYDADLFKKAMREYFDKKSKFEAKQAEQAKAQEEINKEWQAKNEAYAKAKSRFNAEKMADAESEVTSVLSPARQAMLMDVSDDPAAMVVALGQNPEILRKIASIKSDGQAIKEMVKVEMQMKVQSKGKTPPPPERTISGSGRTAGSSANRLEELREKAHKTGDMTEYLAEKRRQKA